jgi:three-Cys-motif partner protein
MVKFDEIGEWSEIKLDIIRDYASEYSKILTAQKRPKLCHIYIDAFAGAGIHISKSTRDFIPGSPLNALKIDQPFCEYHLIDLKREKVNLLYQLTEGFENVYIYQKDCNNILLNQVFPRILFKNYRRGFAYSILMVCI